MCGRPEKWNIVKSEKFIKINSDSTSEDLKDWLIQNSVEL